MATAIKHTLHSKLSEPHEEGEVEESRKNIGTSEYQYEFDEAIAARVGILAGSKLSSKNCCTQNNRGYQMSTVNPLVDAWVAGYDGKHWLVDIGAAYGINSFYALHSNIPVLAIDLEEKHLKYIEEVYKQRVSSTKSGVIPQLNTLNSSLPDLIGLPSASVSSILCAEVIHFLDGAQLVKAFARFFEVLVPGGRLALTCVSETAHEDPRIYDRILQRRAAGDPYPGLFTKGEMELIREANVEAWKQRNTPISEQVLKAAFPEILHLFSVSQVAILAENAGFRVQEVRLTSHPGYPAAAASESSNIQLVALKPR